MRWLTNCPSFLFTLLFVAFFSLGAEEDANKTTVVVSGQHVTVSALDPRPLAEAVAAVTAHYGWIVDYEDPIYTFHESRDITSPLWRQAHPKEQGVLIPSGGKFVASFSIAGDAKVHEEAVLENMVAQYNRSDNPGHFHMIRTPLGRLVVVGKSGKQINHPGPDPLDVMIQPERDSQNAGIALDTLLIQCSSAGTVKIVLGTAPANALGQYSFTGNEAKTSCRNELERLLSASPYRLSYRLLYGIDSQEYALNIHIVR